MDKDRETSRDRSTRSDARSDQRSDRRDSRDQHRDVRGSIKFGKAADRGLRINTVVRDSIFFKSGFRESDVIVSVNGRRIRSEDEFFRLIVVDPGRRIPVVVLRDGREQTIYITYEEEVATRERREGGVYFGAEFDREIKDAAVVIRVDEGSPADRAGLRRNDVVVALNGEQVKSPNDAMDIIDSMKPGQRLDIEYSRYTRAGTELESSRREVASRPTEERVNVDRTRETSVKVEAAPSDARRADSDRDRGIRDRDRTERGYRGILPRRRGY